LAVFMSSTESMAGCWNWLRWAGWNEDEVYRRAGWGPSQTEFSIPVLVQKGYPGNDSVTLVTHTSPSNAAIQTYNCYVKWAAATGPFGIADCNGADFGWGRFTGVTISTSITGKTLTTTCRNHSAHGERECALEVCYRTPAQ
jgi:hypothetical protein